MKKIYILLTIMGAYSSVNAQSIERQVIGSAGGSFSGAVQVDWTVGETVVATATGGSSILTQGFHQPQPAASGVKTTEPATGLVAYPNPTGSVINLQWKNAAFTGTLVLYDAIGRVVWSSSLATSNLTTIDMSQFTPGVYNLQVNGENQKSSVLRITRI